jgi:hypothetical protein
MMTNKLSFQDRLLLARPFQIETYYSLEDCKKRLKWLHQPREDVREPYLTVCDVFMTGNHVEFDLRLKRKRRYGYQTIVHALGRVDDINGKRIVRGSVQRGSMFLLGLGVFLFCLLLPLVDPLKYGCFVFLGVGILIYVYITTIGDRDILYQTILDTLICLDLNRTYGL